MEYKKQSLIILAIVVIIAIIIYVFSSSNIEKGVGSRILDSEENSLVNEKIYESEVSYRGPRGNEVIYVELTLNGKKIVDISTKHSNLSDQSLPYTDGFDDEYRAQVVGKNIDEVNLDIIAGASNTTEAFIEALQDIQGQI